MKKMMMTALFCSALLAGASIVHAQDAAGAAPAPMTDTAAASSAKDAANAGFINVVLGSGFVGIILWAALFGCGMASIYFIVDGFILVKPQKIMPQGLIDNVQAAMAEGDVVKALDFCGSDPSPMSKILTAGFSHVEEGFEVIEEAIVSAGDMEIERLMQRLNWISVCANLAPMLGLLGTVQGMILTFQALAVNGAGDIGSLSISISQALWTTAGGLVIAIPSVAFFYVLRNNANRLILRMQAITTDLVKDLRNVEVIAE